MQESWSLTTVIAAYGAVVSTLVALWNGWHQWQQRGRLRCTFELNFQYPKTEVGIRIANIGARPITVRYIKARDQWQRLWGRARVVCLRGEYEDTFGVVRLPHVLAPEDSVVVDEPEHGWQLRRCTRLWIEDQAGHVWPVERAELNRGRDLEARAAELG
jgi:hypothetical protein